jgi:vancomycin permeability regulator SanA
MDRILVKRLEMALQLLREEKIYKVICTGGRPRMEVTLSEAEVMYNYLVEHGVDPELIIKEEKSGSTFGNAKYSVPIAKKLGANRIIIVTTIEHFTNYDYNPLKIFSEFINDDNIRLMIYTNTVPTL